ncbi:SNF2-related protein [Desulfobacterales bacterium HSG16]|nr:SNF2-related protein [Desulfobacterales bacterium HSG16]
MNQFEKDDIVRHSKLGTGNVITDMGATVIVRFVQNIEECAKEDLKLCPSLTQRLERDEWDIPLEVINRVQAEAICSINDMWGVFARSQIQLFPHQLWVCRQVNKEWPMHWLVADDVGLGKTIEAGLILTPLIASGKVKRLLIMCPASLVSQWQIRLKEMFDIRAANYVTAADTKNSSFWETHNQVIASLHTLKLDKNDRHQRLLESEPWDLLIVDEGHHLNADEHQGLTLGYQLVRQLRENNCIQSMIFFTGTPHRGKDYGFVSLLQLLRPDLFDNNRPISEQLNSLKEVMIRNNKYNVTYLDGKRIFQEPVVNSETYFYSEYEQRFYDMLSEFIVEGRAYASNLSETMSNAAMLVLISMQKLASSSVAAIRRAIRGRLERIRESREKLQNYQKKMRSYQDLEENELDNEVAQDKMAQIEEEIMLITSQLHLVVNEESALQELLEASEIISEETKINRALEVLKNQFKDRSVLFFTEYKATQSLLMSALIKQFGDDCVTFINGDRRADEVICSDGDMVSLTKSKKEAAEDFNSGKVRFLVATEAGGEGIDLQENCYTLVHVDMPWNPMRMHQRVGRLVRIGQNRQVEVLILRNPDTVETRIWDKLNDKIDRINSAFREVMPEPEDMFQLVLGMTSPSFFRDIFVEANQTEPEDISNWFDQKAATFGGKDVLETVRDLIGNVNKFDFKKVSDQIPRADLPDLRPFFESALSLNGRRITAGEEGSLTFKTPDVWKTGPAIRPRYTNMTFDRSDRSQDARNRLLGVGHKIVDKALEQTKTIDSAFATIPENILSKAIIIFRVIDRVTEGAFKPDVIVAVKIQSEDNFEMMRDWELLKYLNKLPVRKDVMRDKSRKPEDVQEEINRANSFLSKNLKKLDLDFRVPDIEVLSILWPGKSDME